jgi:salicylate 5-hydroxylase large subunit
VVFLQQVNSLQIRQIIPKAVDEVEFVWTFFGFEDDDEEMYRRRIRHGNLFGPAGLVNADDCEVVAMSQESFKAAENEESVVLMGRGGSVNSDAGSLATESPVRGFYEYYREVMGL